MRRTLLALVVPSLLAAQDRGTVLVANQASASATVIHLADGRTTHIPVGTGPHEAAILPDGRRGVVTIYGDRGTVGRALAVIDLPTQRLDRRIDLGQYTRPHGVQPIAGRPDEVAVTSETTRQVVIVNVRTGTVVRAIPTEAPTSHMVALPRMGPQAGRGAWTANVATGTVSEVDLETGAHRRVVPVASATEGIAVTPDGAEVWVGSNDRGTVSVVSAATGAVTDTVSALGMPYRLAISADGRLAVAVDARGDRIVLIDVRSRRVVGEVPGLDAPRGVVITPDGRTALVTSAGTSTVIVVDLPARRELRRLPVESAPDGVAVAVP